MKLHIYCTFPGFILSANLFTITRRIRATRDVCKYMHCSFPFLCQQLLWPWCLLFLGTVHFCQNQIGLNVSQQTRPKRVISQLFNKYVHISCLILLCLYLHICTKMWPHKKFVFAHPFKGRVCMWGDRHVYLVTIEIKIGCLYGKLVLHALSILWCYPYHILYVIKSFEQEHYTLLTSWTNLESIWQSFIHFTCAKSKLL